MKYINKNDIAGEKMKQSIRKDEKQQKIPSTKKSVSFRRHENKDVIEFIEQTSNARSHVPEDNKHVIWYTPQELEVFKHQARLETKQFRHSCHSEDWNRKPDKMNATSLLESWSNSMIEMKTILLSELDNYRLSSFDGISSPKTRETLTTSRGLESRIFYQHQQNKLLASREILKYHKKSQALLQEASKTMHPDAVKRLRKISAYRLACLSAKCSSWAKQAALKTAQLDRSSVLFFSDRSTLPLSCPLPSNPKNVLQEKSSTLNTLVKSLKRKRCATGEFTIKASPVRRQCKKPRRGALSCTSSN